MIARSVSELDPFTRRSGALMGQFDDCDDRQLVMAGEAGQRLEEGCEPCHG